MPDYGDTMSIWAVLPVFLLLGVFIALSVWLRRFAAPGRQDIPIEVVGSKRLDGQNTVYVVDIEGRRYLMGTGRDGVRLLGNHSKSVVKSEEKP